MMFGRSSIQTWLVWAAMVLYLLTNLSPDGSGLVLCIGSDGHVAIEVATSEADCSDCVPSELLVESCCSVPEPGPEQVPADCTCYDIPLIASTADVDSTAPQQKGPMVAAPPCILARTDFLVAPPSLRSFDLRSRAQSPPCPRVPALLTLRI